MIAAWGWTLLALLGCAAVGGIYSRTVRPGTARMAAFLTGLVVLVAALASPLATLGDRYLFSAHMLQQVLLTLAAAPLLVYSVPPAILQQIHWGRALTRIARTLGQPTLAWLVGVGVLAVWQTPDLADAAVTNGALHALEVVSLLEAAALFWWPVLGPVPEQRRLTPLMAIVYLVLASLADSALGALVTVASGDLYPVYAHPAGQPGFVLQLRHVLSLSATADQQLGGSVLWVGNAPIYVLVCLAQVVRWYYAPEADLVEAEQT